jgi:uncharacterized protein YqgV (UPF0045/DUF77 family)
LVCKNKISIYYDIEDKDKVRDAATEGIISNDIKSLEKEDYDNFFMKQLLPKNMKKIDLKLFKMGSRKKEDNISSKVVNQVPNHMKKMIDIKYHLKKMETRISNGRTELNQIIKNVNTSPKYKRDYFRSTNNISYMDDQPPTPSPGQSPFLKNKTFMTGSPANTFSTADRFDDVRKQTIHNF